MKTILILILVSAACVVSGYLLHLYKKSLCYNTGCSSAELEATEFCVADYLDRIEAAAIRLWEEQEPLDTTITLWWGLDGLKRSENGKLEWVNRAREKSSKTVTYPNGVTDGCIDISWDYEIIGDTFRRSKNATIRPLFRMCDVENDIDRSFAGTENAVNSRIQVLQMAQELRDQMLINAQQETNQNIINQLNQINQCCSVPGYPKVDIF